MPKKSPNSSLLGCLTLLAAYGAADLELAYAATLPDEEPQADDLNNTDESLTAETAISDHAQTINPDGGSSPSPSFVARANPVAEAVPDHQVAPAVNDPAAKLQHLLATSPRDDSANSNLLAAKQEETIAAPLQADLVEDTAGVNGVEIEVAETITPVVGQEPEAPSPVVLVEEPVALPLRDTEMELSSSPLEAEINPVIVAAAVADAAVEEPVQSPLEPAAVGLGAAAELAATEISQIPLEPPLPGNLTEEADQLLDELLEDENSFQETPGYASSPALTISNPSGFGADNRTAFLGVGYQERTRFGNNDDGALVVGVGLGDARENLGVQLSYTAASFGGSRDFGAGGFNVKLHKRLSEDWSVAVGWEGIITTDSPVDFKDSVYGSVTHIVRTQDSVSDPLSRIALTAGVGTGRFRTEEDVFDKRDTVGVFGSAALRLAEPVSAIVEWTGQDLAAGLSITPFKDIPLVLLPAVRDITGAGDGARFVMGAGFSFKF